MRTISFAAFKGGAGKTTTLMAATSALLERGLSVGLFEADDNRPLQAWRDYAQARGTWDEACAIYEACDLVSLERAFEAAEAARHDVVLVDTSGGLADLNQTIFLNSDLVVLPTRLGAIELDEALQTLQTLAQMIRAAGLETPMGLFVNRSAAAERDLSATDRQALRLISELPVFAARLPDRQAFADLKSTGLLHRHLEQLLASPGRRLMAPHVRTALSEARCVADEFLAILSDRKAA